MDLWSKAMGFVLFCCTVKGIELLCSVCWCWAQKTIPARVLWEWLKKGFHIQLLLLFKVLICHASFPIISCHDICYQVILGYRLWLQLALEVTLDHIRWQHKVNVWFGLFIYLLIAVRAIQANEVKRVRYEWTAVCLVKGSKLNSH